MGRSAIHPGEHLAEQLEALDTSAEFWMNLQTRYELRLAEQKSGDTIRTLRTLDNRWKTHGDDSVPQPV